MHSIDGVWVRWAVASSSKTSVGWALLGFGLKITGWQCTGEWGAIDPVQLWIR